MGLDAVILVFWMLSFKSTFSLCSFTFIKRRLSSSLSAVRVVSSAYLKLLILVPAILIPACVSSNLAFYMMYSAYKLNKQGDNIQPWHTPFCIWNQPVVPRPVLTLLLDLHRRQVRWSGFPISLRIFHRLLCSFPSPGESSQPRNRTQVSQIAGRFFTNWAIREAWIGNLVTKILCIVWATPAN